ncbi:maleylpyruvate isomerase N-terminal domain-containing protein [Streptomyces sp. SAI-218]|uniref:maleylpyruvate isomerase N-terminal domain-containing protein n=1 Tax=Streptomyces sp. SAI-218 TaxID=3377736 RepID=UPI003C7A092B
MSGPPEGMLEWAAKGTAAFEAAVDGVTDAGLTAASCLPGWSRAHVVAHVARNADALGEPADLGPHRRRDPHVHERQPACE